MTDLALLRAAFEQSWNAIVVTDANVADGCPVLDANPSFCRMTGYALDELVGKSLRMLQGPDTDPAVIESLRQSLRSASPFDGTTTNYRKDGTPYIVHWSISPIRDEQGQLTYFMSVQQDISRQVRAEQSNRLFARALDATSDAVLITDDRARIEFANAAFTELSGYPFEQIRGKTPAFLRSGVHDEAFYTNLRKLLQKGEDFRATFVNRRRDGSLYHAEQSISPIIDEARRITHYVSVSKDVTERVQLEEELRAAATRDKLTGLYNRRYGESQLREACLNARASGSPLSILLCDIDHFKQVNDRFGHDAGDRVLREFSRVLARSVRASDTVARWGGEEFVVVLADCSLVSASDLAERIRGQIALLDDEQVGRISVSVGVATLAADETAKQLYLRADAALYQAKNGGRNRVSIAATPIDSADDVLG